MARIVTCGEEVGILGGDLVGAPRASSHWDHGGGIFRVARALRQGVGPCGHSRAGQVPPPQTCWRQVAGAAGVCDQAGWSPILRLERQAGGQGLAAVSAGPSLRTPGPRGAGRPEPSTATGQLPL